MEGESIVPQKRTSDEIEVDQISSVDGDGFQAQAPAGPPRTGDEQPTQPMSQAGKRFKLSKELRTRTGRSVVMCKKALEVSDDDLERAEKWLNRFGKPNAATLLRENSGASASLCNRAIEKHNGDVEKAADWLKQFKQPKQPERGPMQPERGPMPAPFVPSGPPESDFVYGRLVRWGEEPEIGFIVENGGDGEQIFCHDSAIVCGKPFVAGPLQHAPPCP